MFFGGRGGPEALRPKNLGGGRRPFRLLWPVWVLLLLAVGSGSGFAAGDLFDDDYKDCPHRTRLRDGQIDALTVSRDADEADAVNVSWTATDPATWGLGPNNFSAALVLLLDDQEGDPVARTLSLGSRKTTFEDVKTGTEVTVQMAIVVDTADGDYLISDILEASLHQSLTEPAFKVPVWQGQEGKATGGTFYYIGYGDQFWNFRNAPDGPDMATIPVTERLRIGLAHAPTEDDDAREVVKFDSYILRITDGDGDVVPEGDDVATRDANTTRVPGPAGRTLPSFPYYGQQALYMGDVQSVDTTELFSNVRINDGGTVRAGMFANCVNRTCTGDAPSNFRTRRTTPDNQGLTAWTSFPHGQQGSTTLWAHHADAFRDFPLDVLASDETYTLTAWAVNEDGEVLSPRQTLTVHPLSRTITFPSPPGLTASYGAFADVNSLIVTEFTVLE